MVIEHKYPVPKGHKPISQSLSSYMFWNRKSPIPLQKRNLFLLDPLSFGKEWHTQKHRLKLEHPAHINVISGQWIHATKGTLFEGCQFLYKCSATFCLEIVLSGILLNYSNFPLILFFYALFEKKTQKKNIVYLEWHHIFFSCFLGIKCNRTQIPKSF